jgi:hypothetical protein
MDLIRAGLRPEPFKSSIPWLASDDGRFWAGVDLGTGRFAVDLLIDQVGRQRWLGPLVDMSRPLSVELAFHPDMGPGGILWRSNGYQPWSSMSSQSAGGLEAFEWPKSVDLQSEHLQMRCAIIPLDLVKA